MLGVHTAWVMLLCGMVGLSAAESSAVDYTALIGEVELAGVDAGAERFSFALVADPQVGDGRENTSNPVERQSNINMDQTVQELNVRDDISFVVWNGDMVGSVSKPNHVENFLTRLKPLKHPSVLVHGNHEKRYPYKEFIELQREVSGLDKVAFSWDVGAWHFVTIPCNWVEDSLFQEMLYAWLDQDLAANRDRPVMIFVHEHLLPQGLTQLQGYTYSKKTQLELLDLFSRYGNVKYTIFGHVHNGIKTAQKLAWEYRGIRFLTAPTGCPPRNFGEEYPQFSSGMADESGALGGGYYLVIDIDGDRATIKGRVVDVDAEHVFKDDAYVKYTGQDPLFHKTITDYPANDSLLNGDFENGLENWTEVWRYKSDFDPGFVVESVAGGGLNGSKGARVLVKEKGQTWSRDTIHELYQWSRVDPEKFPVLGMHYRLPELPTEGGGYIRFNLFSEGQHVMLILLNWRTTDTEDSLRMATHSVWMATGEKYGGGNTGKLKRMGRSKQALFVKLPVQPDEWQEVLMDLPKLYNQAAGEPGRFESLKIDHVLTGLGVWCKSFKGSVSQAVFDDITFRDEVPGAASLRINGVGQPVSAALFQTDFN